MVPSEIKEMVETSKFDIEDGDIVNLKPVRYFLANFQR